MEKRRGSGRVPVPIETIETELGLDRPREAHPDDDTPTKPEIVVMPQCIVCHGDKSVLVALEDGVNVHRHRREECSHCNGTGWEP